MTIKKLFAGLLLGAAALAWSSAGLAEEGAAAPSYSKKGADTCLGCHSDEPALLGIFRTKHGAPNDERSPFGHGQLQCESCHGPGGAHTARVPRGQERPAVIRFGGKSPTPVVKQNGQCLNCHNADLGEWHGSQHSVKDTSCADCHSAHKASDPVLKASTQPQVCFTCHENQRTNSLKPYTHPIRDKQLTCTGCHSPHGSMAKASLKRDTVTETCFTCHADKRGPFLWEHAPVADDCTLCHSPHGSANPAMLTKRAPLLCQQCHSSVGHPSVAYTPNGLPGASPSAYLLNGSCTNCHSAVHGSNHPSGASLAR